MKKLILLATVLFSSVYIFAQQDNRGDNSRQDNQIHTLMGRNHQSNGGYGSFGAGYTIIDGKDAATLTGRAAWIMGHSVALGFAGTGFVNSFTPDVQPDRFINLTGGYGGLLFEPILLPRFPVHLSFPMIAGVGGIAYTSSYKPANSWDYYDTWVEDTQTYLIAEPGVELELNVLKFFRMSFGLSYRFTTDINWIYTGPDVLEGWNAGMSFKFGKF
ncbi:MAG: hypothetical protein H6538_02440 [Bacteroidales bacterium]|nr:hypothetical protein [Bacteroidales bacterium]MCB8999279.1 hypothetical protein [Bacteroidales bacterium]MCB9013051.1 hypothetical protein [Bacteroidales bacterium]